MKIKKERFFYLLLGLIFFLGFILRIAGVKPGYPGDHPDEPVVFSTAIEAVLERTADISQFPTYRFQYPALLIYFCAFLEATFLIPFALAKSFLLNPAEFFLNINHLDNFVINSIVGRRQINALFWGRYIVAFLGSLSLPLIYLVGKKLFNRYVGLIAALFLAANFRHVVSSHFALVDAPNATFALLMVYLSLLLWEKPTRKNFCQTLCIGIER